MYLRLIIILLFVLPVAGKGQIILDTMYFNQNWSKLQSRMQIITVLSQAILPPATFVFL